MKKNMFWLVAAILFLVVSPTLAVQRGGKGYDSGNQVTGNLYVTKSTTIDSSIVGKDSASFETLTSTNSLEVRLGITSLRGLQYVWPSFKAGGFAVLKYTGGDTLTWEPLDNLGGAQGINGAIQFRHPTTANFSADTENKFVFVQSSGFLGINTAVPGVTLDVYGSEKIRNNVTLNWGGGTTEVIGESYFRNNTWVNGTFDVSRETTLHSSLTVEGSVLFKNPLYASKLFWNESTGWLTGGINNPLTGGSNSLAFGNTVSATGNNASIALGYNALASGATSVALGEYATAISVNSMAIGHFVSADANDAIVIGKGVSDGDRLNAVVANSLQVGFNRNTPAFMVLPGESGVIVNAPARALSDASYTFEVNASSLLRGNAKVTGNTIMTGTLTVGSIATFGTIATVATPISSDALIGDLFATRFRGNGSKLTNLPTDQMQMIGDVTGQPGNNTVVNIHNHLLGNTTTQDAGVYNILAVNGTSWESMTVDGDLVMTSDGAATRKIHAEITSGAINGIEIVGVTLANNAFGSMRTTRSITTDSSLHVQGKVGIGSLDATAKLDVTGDMKVSSTFEASGATVYVPNVSARASAIDIASATFTPGDKSVVLVMSTGGSAVTTIAGGVNGRVLTLVGADDTKMPTLSPHTGAAGNAGNIALSGSVAFILGINDSITLMYIVDKWVEIARSDNYSTL